MDKLFTWLLFALIFTACTTPTANDVELVYGCRGRGTFTGGIDSAEAKSLCDTCFETCQNSDKMHQLAMTREWCSSTRTTTLIDTRSLFATQKGSDGSIGAGEYLTKLYSDQRSSTSSCFPSFDDAIFLMKYGITTGSVAGIHNIWFVVVVVVVAAVLLFNLFYGDKFYQRRIRWKVKQLFNNENQFSGIPPFLYHEIEDEANTESFLLFKRYEKDCIEYFTTSQVKNYRTLQDYQKMMREFSALFGGEEGLNFGFSKEHVAKQLYYVDLPVVLDLSAYAPWKIFSKLVTDPTFMSDYDFTPEDLNILQKTMKKQIDVATLNECIFSACYFMCVMAIHDERLELYYNTDLFAGFQQIVNQLANQILSNNRQIDSLCILENVFSATEYSSNCNKYFFDVFPVSLFHDLITVLDNLKVFIEAAKSKHIYDVRCCWYRRIVGAIIDYIDATKKEVDTFCNSDFNGGTFESYVSTRAGTVAMITVFPFVAMLYDIDLNDELYDRFIIKNKFNTYCSAVTGVYNDLISIGKDKNALNRFLKVKMPLSDLVLKSKIIAENRLLCCKKHATFKNYTAVVNTTQKLMISSHNISKNINVFQYQMMTFLSSFGTNYWQLKAPRYSPYIKQIQVRVQQL